MIITISLVSVVIFLLAFSFLRIVPVASDATKTALKAVSAIRDPLLDETAREKTIQKFSISLFGSFFSILIRSVAALLAAAAPIYAADKLEFLKATDVSDFLSRWDIILILTLVICTGWYIKSRLWPSR